jgi:hypothetical protein
MKFQTPPMTLKRLRSRKRTTIDTNALSYRSTEEMTTLTTPYMLGSDYYDLFMNIIELFLLAFIEIFQCVRLFIHQKRLANKPMTGTTQRSGIKDHDEKKPRRKSGRNSEKLGMTTRRNIDMRHFTVRGNVHGGAQRGINATVRGNPESGIKGGPTPTKKGRKSTRGK